MTEKSTFEKLAAINVSEHIEKKGRFNYLSWAWAVDQLLRADPSANWTHGEPVVYPDTTMMVNCTVTAFGKSMTMHLPVLNGSNKPIPQPNAFDINTSMMRCLVKAIALHGIGLYIYAGEDLPLGEEAESNTITEEQLAKLNDVGKEVGANMAQYCRAIKVEQLSDLHADQFNQALALLERKRKPAEVQNATKD